MIRPEEPRDRGAIVAVTRDAFEGSEVEVFVVQHTKPLISLVYEDEGRVVGHVLVSRATVAGRPAAMIGPLSVRPERQRQGIGGALMHAAIEATDARGEPIILLLGHPTYYPRFGFRLASELGIDPPDERMQGDAWMALPLSAYDPALRGRATFPPAFP